MLNGYLANTYHDGYLTNTYQFLHDNSPFNWSFTKAKLILIDFLIKINIYQHLTVTY